MFEIGNSLREARTRRRIEFAQVEQATKIRGKYLRALEEEQFDTLPSETYVKGFLRTYADYLGLDGQLYVDEFNSRFVVGESAERRLRPPIRRRERRILRNFTLLAIAAIAAVTVVVISAWQTFGSGHSPPPVAKKTVVRHRAPAAYLEISAVKGPSTVIVNKASVNGRILFQGTLGQKDPPLAFDGKRFWLNIGSPENLVIEVGGRRVHLAGYRPFVLTVTPSGWHSHPA